MVLIFNACRNDQFYSGELMLNFSEDTLRFDTVFTELGSATRYVKIFNPHPDAVNIETLAIEGGDQSFFRMNVDGESGQNLSNILIPSNDSVYVFIEVTIDPDNPLSESPFVIEDKLLINGNETLQDVHLEAWGQNANYIPAKNSPGAITLLPCQNGVTVWDDPKPYVIYGILLIDECDLQIAAGTQIYVHGGVVNSQDLGIYNDGLILVGPNGKITANGTVQDTIVFQGDRLELPFLDDPGQWQGLRFLAESRQNRLDNVTVKNSIFGVWLDSLAQVDIRQSKIYNTTSVGVVAIHADLDMQNTLIHSNLNHSVQCLYGGNYNFDYCTFASYGTDREALRLSNYICRDVPFCTEADLNTLNIQMNNCLVAGSLSEELFLDDLTEGDGISFNYQFKNCIVRIDSILDDPVFGDFFNFCENCIELNTSDNDTLFVDIDNEDFHLDTMSVAEGKGRPIGNVLIDLDGKLRDASTPDIGCYEFQE